MAKVIYLGEAGGTRETTQYGYSFSDGKPVDVDEPKHLAKFAGNAYFKVSAGEKQPVKTTVAGLQAVHNGGGRFVIKRDGEIIKEGLNKADADAFNQLSSEDQEAYIS